MPGSLVPQHSYLGMLAPYEVSVAKNDGCRTTCNLKAQRPAINI
jgi:hypothetical protein